MPWQGAHSGCLVAFFFLGLWSNALAETKPRPDDAAALQGELRALDAQIQSRLAEEALRGSKTGALDDKQRLAEEMLRGNGEIAKKGSASLKRLDETAEREAAAMTGAALDARQTMETARTAAHTSAALLLERSRTHGPSDERTLALALLYKHHQEAAEGAISQGLKLEELQANHRQSHASIQSRRRDIEDLTSLPMGELRRRHSDLTRRLASARKGSAAQEKALKELEAQKTALNDLVARLSSGKMEPGDLERLAKAYEITPAPTAVAAAAEQPDPADLRKVESTKKVDAFTSDPPPLPLDEDSAATGAEAEAAFNERGRITLPKNETIEPRILAAGHVLFSGTFAGYSHLLIIDHGEGWTMVYANLSRCPWRAGEEVKSGDKAGRFTAEAGQPGAWVEARKDSKLRTLDEWPGAGDDWWERLILP